MNYKRLGILAVITLATVGIVWATCPPDDNKWFWGMVTELGGTGIPDVTVQATPCSAINPGDCSPGNEPGHDTQSGITDATGRYQIGSPTQNLHFGHHTVKLEVVIPMGWEACPSYPTTIYVDVLCGENRYDFKLCRPPTECDHSPGYYGQGNEEHTVALVGGNVDGVCDTINGILMPYGLNNPDCNALGMFLVGSLTGNNKDGGFLPQCKIQGTKNKEVCNDIVDALNGACGVQNGD